MIKIVIADDHQLFRESLTAVLNGQTDFEVVAACSDSQEATDIVAAEKPDIVLMDINIQPFSGMEATRKICAVRSTGIIGLSMHAHPSYVKKMMAAGCMGYITKNSSTEEIFTGVRMVNSGKKFLCEETKNELSAQLLYDGEKAPSLGILTPRELELIQYIKQGLSSKEIGVLLSVSLKTIEVHRHNILKKLRLNNTSQLVNFIYHNTGYNA